MRITLSVHCKRVKNGGFMFYSGEYIFKKYFSLRNFLTNKKHILLFGMYQKGKRIYLREIEEVI